MTDRCLFCYEPLTAASTPAEHQGFHVGCSKRMFGQPIPPVLDIAQSQLQALAEQVVQSQISVTGVQPKLSLSISDTDAPPSRFTIVGLWGAHILKPQTEQFPHLPENEDLTMHLAQSCGIPTVPHALIRMASGELAYLTRRIDRVQGQKIAMEDFCQLTERLTEHKYRGSHEQVARVLQRHSSNPGFDVVSLYERVLFCFLTGNNDMHLKNFSLIRTPMGYGLSPAYDLVASALVVEGDDEELALTLNGKKRRLTRADFAAAMQRAGVQPKAIENVLNKYLDASQNWPPLIAQSFLPPDLQRAYLALIQRRISQLA